MSVAQRDAERRIREWARDPVAFVRDEFNAEPDTWQADALRATLTNKRVAMAACKGPGKSCVEAWWTWWLLATNRDAKGICCSITADNLRDNLWTELATWQSKSELLKRAFTWGAERIVSNDRPETWWCSARSFPSRADKTQQANTLAGLHGRVVFVVLDEVGDYPHGVLDAAEGIFADKTAYARELVAGNATKINGPLHRITTTDASLWYTVHITGDPDDPKRSPRIDVEWAREQIKLKGRNNPIIMVNILGQFPPQGYDRLISVNDIIEAQKRDVPFLAYRSDARVWGLDPAYMGDDESVLCRRQGQLCRRFTAWSHLDGPDLAACIAQMFVEAEKEGESPDALFVDRGGIGASAYDHLKRLGWEDRIIGVDFGGGSQSGHYFDKRSEMWADMAEWLKGPACLPQDPLLVEQLTAPAMKYREKNKRTVLKLQSKEELRTEGVRSPDRADALALTFARPVMPLSRAHRERIDYGERSHRAKTEWDPLERDA